jgi:mitochondrial fission protein ELM1
MPAPPTCWVVSNGFPGNEIQCCGLAEALGLRPEIKRIAVRKKLLRLPFGLPFYLRLALSPRGDVLRPPWPDLLIATGSKSAFASLGVRAASRRRGSPRPTYVVQIHEPPLPFDRFDLLVIPQHNGTVGANVLNPLGSMHRITPALLAAARARIEGTLGDLPRPLVAVCLGGNSSAYRLEPARAAELGRSLAEMARQDGVGLLVTPSRRTGQEALQALLQPLAGLPHRAWDGTGDNPYFGWLALADAVVVTEDSVNMTCEAAAAGRPVLVAPLEGGNEEFERFHTAMRAAGLARPFAGRLERWQPPPFNEPARIARAVRERLPLPWP